MMRLPLLVLIVGLLTACSPMAGQSPDPGAPTQTAAQACAAQGGQIMRVGRLQTERCVVPFSDAGKTCRDGDDCLGDCRARDPGPREGANVTGVCAPNDLPFGCNTPIENGRAQPTLCVD
jgi:putative hemolysin